MFRVILPLTLLVGTSSTQWMPDGRIVGGQATEIENFPHQVSLQYPIPLLPLHVCGGSIIAPNRILTAAHCVSGSFASFLQIRAGSTSKSSGGKVQNINSIHIHGSYNSTTIDNDIAILKLAGSFTYSSKIQPIALPAANEEIPSGSTAIASGWGTTSEGGSSPSDLRCVELAIVGLEDCANAYADIRAVTENMLCAGVPEGGKDTCQGDSGGPLISDDKLYGITSWGNGCGRVGYPGVYTKVAKFRNWIDSNI